MKDNTSSTSRIRRHLMFTLTEMKKEERLLSGRDIMVQTRDGESSILTQRDPGKELLDTTVNGASISTEHSTLDQDFQ
jgi:hypothetical protein